MQALAASPSEAWHAGWNDGYYDTYGGLRNMNIATLTSYIQGFEAGQDARTGSQQAGAAPWEALRAAVALAVVRVRSNLPVIIKLVMMTAVLEELYHSFLLTIF